MKLSKLQKCKERNTAKKLTLTHQCFYAIQVRKLKKQSVLNPSQHEKHTRPNQNEKNDECTPFLDTKERKPCVTLFLFFSTRDELSGASAKRRWPRGGPHSANPPRHSIATNDRRLVTTTQRRADKRRKNKPTRSAQNAVVANFLARLQLLQRKTNHKRRHHPRTTATVNFSTSLLM